MALVKFGPHWGGWDAKVAAGDRSKGLWRSIATLVLWSGLAGSALAGGLPAPVLPAVAETPVGTVRYIVKYHSGAERQLAGELERLAQTAQTALQNTPGGAPIAGSNRPLVRHNASRDIFSTLLTPSQVDRLEADPRIAYVERDWSRYPLANAPAAQQEPYGIGLIEGTNLSTFGAPRKICVIDSGYELSHDDLPGLARVTGEAQPGTGAWDQPGGDHGTHVSGTILARDNGIGVVGVNRSEGLTLHVIKFFDDNEQQSNASDLVAAVDACVAAGAHVINMSLGGAGYSETNRQAMQDATDAGVLVVAAAGNNGDDGCFYPACYESVFSVAAVTAGKQIASFSQRNTEIEIAAPGVGVLSTVTGNGYTEFSGTSMAAPHVAGGAALLWSLHPQCSNQQIRNALIASAEDLGETGRDSAYGYGLVNLQAADDLFVATGSCDVPLPPSPRRVVVIEEGDLALGFGEERLWSVELPAEAYNLSVSLSGGFGDADLFVREGAPPTSSAFDCVSDSFGNSERCDFATPTAPSTYYIAVRGFLPFVQARLRVTYLLPPLDEPDARTIILDKRNVQILEGKNRRYRLNLPQGATDLRLEINGGTGNADLYTRAGLRPTRWTYDCRPFKSGNNELCVEAAPEQGVYDLMIWARSAVVGLNVKASFVLSSEPPPPPPPPPEPEERTVLLERQNLQIPTATNSRFRVSVPAGATDLRIQLSGGSGNADLYVRAGSRPTRWAYDCRSFQAGNAESCVIESPAQGNYELMIWARSAVSGLRLTVSYVAGVAPPPPPPPPPPPQEERVVLLDQQNLSIATASNRRFRVQLPAGASDLRVELSGGSGNADLYTSADSQPTRWVYDCRSFSPGNDEQCIDATPRAGLHHVMVWSRAAAANMQLRVSYLPAATTVSEQR